jgi:hypothetical protein
MRIQHFPPERVSRPCVFKGSFVLAYRIASPVRGPNPCLNSFTVPKYKKSSIPSTMTALHVVQPPPARPHVDVFVCPLRSYSTLSHDLARARARSYPHSPPSSDPTHNIDGSFVRSTTRRYPCCPRCSSGLILSRRHISSHTQCSQLLPSMFVSSFTPLRVIVLLSLPALQLYNE